MLSRLRSRYAAVSSMAVRLLPWIYLLYAVPSLFLLTWLTPPFQAPDEEAHFLRAESIVHGALLMHREEYEGRLVAGARIDKNVWIVSRHFAFLWGNRDAKVTEGDWAKVRTVGWGGQVVFQPLPAVAVYPPFFYAPQVIAIAAAKAFHASIVHTLYLARLLNGLTAISLAFVALTLCTNGGSLLFTVLLLPMTNFLFASSSQDAVLISASVLTVAWLIRLSQGQRVSLAALVASGLFIFMLATARPPLLVLAVPWMLVALRVRRSRQGSRVLIATVLGISLAALGWLHYLTTVQSEYRIGLTSATAQLTRATENPSETFRAIANTLAVYGESYFNSAVGVLGWLDTRLPDWYYGVAMITLVLALAGSGVSSISRLVRLAAAAAIVTYVVAVFFIQYVVWTPRFHDLIEGVQGRYFLPIFPLTALLVPRWARIEQTIVPLVVAFPALSFAVMVLSIVRRYYLIA